MNQEQLSRVTAIIEQLDERLQEPPENRRKAERIHARFPLEVLVLSGPAPVPLEVYSRNISASGISFMTRRLFQSQERVVLSLKIPRRPGKLIFAQASFARYLRGGFYEVGAEFLECISSYTGREQLPPHWMTEAARQREASRFQGSDPLPGTEKPRKAKPASKPTELSEAQHASSSPNPPEEEVAAAPPPAPTAA